MAGDFLEKPPTNVDLDQWIWKTWFDKLYRVFKNGLSGGATDTILTKASATDYDTAWRNYVSVDYVNLPSTGSKVIKVGGSSALSFDTSLNATFYGTMSLPGGLAFTATGKRITGDFSNATRANRILFQTSTVGSNTNVGAIPNGTTTASFTAFGVADPDNSGNCQVVHNGTDGLINIGKTGTGTQGGLAIQIASSTKVSMDSTGNWTFTQNITNSGTGMRFLADYSNATLANRFLHQDKTTNNATNVGVIPNGSSTTAGLSVYNSATPDNSTFLTLGVTSTECKLEATKVGTGTYKSLNLYNAGAVKFKIDTSGNVHITDNNLILDSSNKIQGDFDDSTRSARPFFQTSNTNGTTFIMSVPNGIGVGSRFEAYQFSDVDNSGITGFGCDSTSGGYINTYQSGIGAVPKLTLRTNSADALSIGALTQNITISKLLVSYNGFTLVGAGIGSIVGRYNSTANTAALAGVTLLASCPADGLYEISYTARVTTAASTSSTLGGATGVIITATDPLDGVSRFNRFVNPDTDATNLTSASFGFMRVVPAKAGTAITCSVGYTSSGATAMQYAFSAIVTYIGLPV